MHMSSDEFGKGHVLPSFLFSSITVSIHYYFVLVSGVQNSGYTTIYDHIHYKVSPPDISSTHLTPYLVITVIMDYIAYVYFASL